MWKKGIQILFKIYIVLIPIISVGQTNKSTANKSTISFHFSNARDTLYFTESIHINNLGSGHSILFNTIAKSTTTPSLRQTNFCVITSYRIDGAKQELADFSFQHLPLDERVKKVDISGYYLIDPSQKFYKIDQDLIPEIGLYDNRPGALHDYINFSFPLKEYIYMKISPPQGFLVNGLPQSNNSFITIPKYKEGAIFIHTENANFKTSLHIDGVDYSIYIIGEIQHLDPFKFEQLQKIILWMHDHYGPAKSKQIVLDLDDFTQKVLNENGFKYYEKYLNFKLIDAISKHWISSVDLENPKDIAWFRNGFTRFNQWKFLEDFGLSQAFLYPYEKHAITTFFDLQDLDFQTILFYEYWMNSKFRQDIKLQSSIEKFSHLNYQTLSFSKTALLLDHLTTIYSRDDYDRLIQDAIAKEGRIGIIPHFNAHFNIEKDWLNKAISDEPSYDDFYIESTSTLEDSLHFTLKNKGNGQYPLEIVLQSDNGNRKIHIPPFEKEFHLKVKSQNWTHIQIDPNGSLIELNKRNNLHKINTIGLLSNIGQLRIQPFLSLHHNYKRQLFLFPSFRWNNYDKSIIGISINNRTFPLLNTQYKFIPEISTSTGKLLGNVGFKTNIYPNIKGLQRIEFSLFYKKNHYDFDLEVARYSSKIKFFLPKRHAADATIRSINLKNVLISAEKPAFDNELQPKNYSVYSLSYHSLNRKKNYPMIVRSEIQWSESFTKFQSDLTMKFSLFSKEKNNSLRVYIGKLFEQKTSGNELAYYAIGISQSNDYLFENLLLGRSDQSGIWSKQFFIDDGGFKTGMNSTVKDFLISSNLQLNIWKNIGVYGDIGLADGIQRPLLWDAGFKLKVVDEFLVFYLPVVSSESDAYKESQYIRNIRFIFNMDVDDIVDKFRSTF